MRPIDADVLPVNFWDGRFVGVAKNDLDNAPTLDVRPNIHAYWVESKEGYLSCSNCHDAMIELYENGQALTPFCPYCGAIMDGEA